MAAPKNARAAPLAKATAERGLVRAALGEIARNRAVIEAYAAGTIELPKPDKKPATTNCAMRQHLHRDHARLDRPRILTLPKPSKSLWVSRVKPD